MNPEARLKLKLSEAQIENQRLRERLSTTFPTVHKDFSLVSRVPKWSGTESAIALEKIYPVAKAQRGLDIGGRLTVFK